MLRHYRRSIKLFWRKTIICVTALVLFIDAGTLAQVMAQHQSEQEHLRIIEEHARAVRTHIDPTLPVSWQQQILCHKYLKTSKRALAKIKARKDTKSLVKDLAVLQNKLKTTHLYIQAELADIRTQLVEGDVAQEILDRLDEFSRVAEDRQFELNRLLSLVQQNQGKRGKLRTSLQELVEFIQPESKEDSGKSPSDPSKPYFPRHSVSLGARRPASPPFFQWPWLLAAAGDVHRALIAAMEEVNSVTGEPNDDDLAIGALSSGEPIPEIDFDPDDPNDLIMAKAEELGYNPVQIFEYVRNELVYEPYFGSLKGAKRTLEEEAGNDMDLASLMIALLRASGIPCRYVLGTIELSMEEAASWFGLEDPNQVIELVDRNGIPWELAPEAPVETIRVDHVWVKAYVDNFPYRGVVRQQDYQGASDGDAWLDMDASFKQHGLSGSTDIAASVGIDMDSAAVVLQQAGDAATTEVNEGYGYVFGIDETPIAGQLAVLRDRISPYLSEHGLSAETAFRQRYVLTEEYGILPITDQYKIYEGAPKDNFSSLPDPLRYKFRVALRNPGDTEADTPIIAMTKSLPELVGKRITLRYVPQDPNHEHVTNTGIDPNFFPLVMSLNPRITVDGEPVEVEGTEQPVNMGRRQDLEMKFITPDGTTDAITHEKMTHSIRAGGIHALVLNPQRITGADLDRHYAFMDEVTKSFDANEVLTPDQTVGDVLHGIGLGYFHYMDRFNQIIGGSLGLTVTRLPSVVRVAWDLTVTSLLGDEDWPYTAASDRVRIAIGRDAYVPVESLAPDRDDPFNPENQFMLMSALTSSVLEHSVLMQAFQQLPAKEAVSVARVIKTANDENDPNVPIYTIINWEDANSLTEDSGPLANLPEYVKNDIKNTAYPEHEITVPKSMVKIEGAADCNYVGYIKRSIANNASDFVLFNADDHVLDAFDIGQPAGAELKDNSVTPVDLLVGCDPNFDPDNYDAVEELIDSTTFWLKTAEGDATNAGLAYLPAVLDINRWFRDRAWLAAEPDPNIMVASVLAVTEPIDRVAEQSAILNVVAGAGSNGQITQYDWVSKDANEFIIYADVTRGVQWEANIYKYGQGDVHLGPISGNEPNLVAIFEFAEPNDGSYQYVLTAGSDANEAIPLEGTFRVDLTEPTAVITDANEPDPDILGVLVVEGTATDGDKPLNNNFEKYEVHVSQYGNEPNLLVYAFTEPVEDGVLATVYTEDFNDAVDVNVILKVWDLAGNVNEVSYEYVDINNPPPADTTDPNITTFSVKINGAEEIEPYSYVSGVIDINVVAQDDHLDKVELRLDRQIIEPNSYEITGGDVNDPNEITILHTLNTYSMRSTGHEISARAVDREGNYKQEYVQFYTITTSDYPVADFRVTPSIATPDSSTLIITAVFHDYNDWKLTFDGNSPITEMTGINDDRIYKTLVATDLNDGDYTVHLDYGDDGTWDANAYFSVMMASPVAEILNDELQAPPNSPPVIDSGFYDLIGTAYHPVYEGNVKYKVELYTFDVAVFDPCPNDFVKNVTPNAGTDGWREGKVEPGSSLGTLDLTGVANGAYQMFLKVKYPASGADVAYDYDYAGFVLDSPLKLGHISFTQEDLVVPVTGMPLKVTRTYNSLRKEQDGAFGHGWTYSVADMDIELNEYRQSFACVGCTDQYIRWDDNYNRDVTLTLPDGRRTTFMFYMAGKYAYFKEAEGVNATLACAPAEKMTGGYWQGQTYTAGAPPYPATYDFRGFVLTTEDYTKYYIKRKSLTNGKDLFLEPGIQFWAEPYGDPYLAYIITPTGEKIDFNVNLYNGHIGDINHYDANDDPTKAIDVTYDGGHIAAIKGPAQQGGSDPNTIEYYYDSNDNLIEVRKLVDIGDGNGIYESTTYDYNDPNDPDINPAYHYIYKIKDARGLSPIQYKYDDSGRLIGIIDAYGREIRLSHADVGGKKAETIYDRFEVPTTYIYDSRGRVIEVINAFNDSTTYDYNDPLYPDGPSAVTVPTPSGPSTTSYEYDSYGKTTKVTDPVGNITEYKYDYWYGKLEETKQLIPTDSGLKTIITTNHYDYDGFLEETIDALGYSTSYEYDPINNNLLEVTRHVTDQNTGQLVDVVTTYTYDEAQSNSSHQPYSIAEGCCSSTRYFQYDDNGNQIKSWYHWEDPYDSGNDCNVYTITEYDAAGRVKRIIRDVNDVSGTVQPSTVVLSQTEYNKIGKPDKVINQHDMVTKYEYDKLGNLVETKVYESNDVFAADPNNYLTITETLYDREGRAIVTTDPHDPCDPNVNGAWTGYDRLGRVGATVRYADVNIPIQDIIVDSNIVGRTNIYDSNGDPVWSYGTELWATSTKYDLGRVAETTSATDQVTRYDYDAAGKQIMVTLEDPDGDGDTNTVYEYEGSHRVLVRDARDNETGFRYDALGRLWKTIYPETAQHGQTYTKVDYDELGRRIEQTDQADHTRWFEYDTAGRLTAVILPDVNDPNNGNTPTYPRYEYDYDNYGNLLTIHDNVKEYADGSRDANYVRETTFAYNELHKRTGRTLPDGRTESWEYDANGMLNKYIDFNEHVTRYYYDAPNAPAQIRYQKFYDSNELNPAEPNMQIHFEYDKLGRKTKVTIDDFDKSDQTIYTYSYDDEGHVTTINSGGQFIGYQYWDTGQIKSAYSPQDASDTKVKYYYDKLARLDEVFVDKRNGDNADESFYYDYNPVGSVDSVTYPNNVTYYDYDELNRLTDVNICDIQDAPLARYVYSLLPDGQRSSATETVGSDVTAVNWTYDALNRLVGEDYDAPGGDVNDFTHSYVYDLVGNRLQRQVVDGNTTYYFYDPNTDELTRELTDDANTFYGYDDNGSLVEEANDASPIRAYTYNYRNRLSSVTAGGTTVDYKYNPEGIRVEADDGTNVTKYIIDPYNHTGYAQVLRQVVNTDANTAYILGMDVLARDRNTDMKYLLYDGHGSVRHLADTAGDITASYNYDGYGRALNFSAANADTSLLYAGEMYDENTQQYYLRARWYSPATARFNRTDPFAGNNRDPQSLHKYLYAHANPVNNIDPSGNFSITSLAVNMAISSMLTGLIMPALSPVLNKIATALMPKWIENALSGPVTAVMVGGGVSGSHNMGSVPAQFNWSTTLEGLVSTSSEGGIAGYLNVGVGLGFGGYGNSISAEGYGGVVFNALKSSDYEGPYISFTFPFMGLPKKMRDGILNKMLTAHVRNITGTGITQLEMFKWMPEKLNKLTASANRLLNNTSVPITISGWRYSDSGGTVAITIGLSYKVGGMGKSSSYVWGGGYTMQLLPSSPVSFYEEN